MSCESSNFKSFIDTLNKNRKRNLQFFFTYIDDEFLNFDFYIRKNSDYGFRGIFTFFSGVFFVNNTMFETIDSLKETFFEKVPIIQKNIKIYAN